MLRSTITSDSLALSHSSLGQEEFERICSNHYNKKSLKISQIQWKTGNSKSAKPSATAITLAELITQNDSLKEIQLDGTPNHVDTATLIRALNRNFDIVQFDMQCSAEMQKSINIILERNRQFRIAQNILLEKLFADLGDIPDGLYDLIDCVRSTAHSDATADQVSYELFNACMRSTSLFPPVSDQIQQTIQQTIDMIKRLKVAGLHYGTNALQAAASLNLPEHAKKLVKSGVNLDIANFRHDNALTMAVSEGHFEIVKLLCENGASKTSQDPPGRTAFEHALSNRRHEIADYLDPAATPVFKKKYFAKRNMIIGFGVSIFDKNHPPSEIAAYNGGGKREGISIIAEYFAKFAARHPHNPKLLRIAEHFQAGIDIVDLSPDELAAKLQTKGISHTITGFMSHICGTSFFKNADGSYQLFLSDRGFFLHRAPIYSDTDKQPCLQSINVPAAVLPAIIKIIISARSESMEVAEQMLFSDIPRLAQSQWRYDDNSLQSGLKWGTCFFSNIKALLLNEIHYIFGTHDGKKLYKEFTLFLRSELLRDYEQYAEESDPYVFLAKKKVQEKSAVFMAKFA